MVAERHVAEAEWTDAERAWMLAIAEYRRLLCPCGCGYLAEVSQAPGNEGRFFVDLPTRCLARTEIDRKAAAYADAAQSGALLFRAELPD